MGESDKKKEDWNFEVPENNKERIHSQARSRGEKASSRVKTLDPRSGKSDTLDRARSKLSETSGKRLKIEDTNEIRKKRTTRAQLAEQYDFQDRMDKLKRTPPVKRLVAGFIDIGILGALGFSAQFLIPMVKKEYIKILVSQGIDQMLDPSILNQYLWIATASALILLFFVLPTIMMRKSIGKSVQGLRVGYSNDGVSISKGEAFVREIILRPISVLSVIGIVLMFTNKKNQALHDLILKTSVYSD